MNFAELQESVERWSSYNFPAAEPWEPLLGVQEEVGELSHAFLKRKQGIRGTREEHDVAIKDAVADITIFLADFCWRNGVDYQAAVDDTWSDVSKRDWRKNKGSGK